MNVHPRYFEVMCPTCKVLIAETCRSFSGYDYKRNYVHSARILRWHKRDRGYGK